MSRSWPERFVIVAAAIVVACTWGCASSGQNEPADSVVSDTPDAVLVAFVRAWNAGDFSRLRATFHPDRRPLLEARRSEVTSRMERWKIESAEVDSLCHPRGGGWKNTTFMRVSPGAEESDAAWVRLDGGSWWMYSL